MEKLKNLSGDSKKEGKKNNCKKGWKNDIKKTCQEENNLNNGK